MELPASLHPKDALVGVAVALLALGGLAVARQATRSRTRQDAARELATWAVLAAGSAIAVALVIAIGRGVVRDVAIGAALATAVVALAAGAGWHRLADDVADRPVTAARCMVALVTISAVGIWAAVPDTEAAVTVLAAWVPFGVVAVVVADRVPRDLPTAGAWCVLALPVAWAAAWGSIGRDSALPGGLACFGAALAVPWVVANRPGAIDARWLLPAHAVAVLAASRWAARATTVAGGLVRSLVVVGLLAAVAAIGVSLARRGRERPRPSPRAGRPR